MLVSLFPYWGFQPFFYILIFLFIDKGDEYQLVNFILNYKKLQFFTQGCVSGVIGYIMYYICASVGEFDSVEDLVE